MFHPGRSRTRMNISISPMNSGLNGGLIRIVKTTKTQVNRFLLALEYVLESCKFLLVSSPFLNWVVPTASRFAYAQMSLQLAKMVYLYDMELVDKNLDWESSCRMHFLWWKPNLMVRFRPRDA